jgi:hypothetical protein
MADTDRTASPNAALVWITQVIAGAIVTGALIFLGIAVYVVQAHGVQNAPEVPLLSYVASAFVAVNMVLSFIIPDAVVRSRLVAIATRKGTGRQPALAGEPRDATALLAVYQTRTIVAYALLEGAALFAGIAYLLEGEPLALIAATGAVLVMLLNFPTRGRVERWLELQQSRLDELRPL